MEKDKVFRSDITRTHSVLENNLYDILTIEPATPLVINKSDNLSCDFAPRTDKYFVPKKKIRFKVKTVRDIRNLFENDIYSTLEHDLEKQQNILFRKIRVGSSKDEKTRLLATNMLKSEKPISRVAWQMVINVNPNDHTHASQYVLWNGKCIQVNGSRGGKHKFICKYDLGSRRASLLHGDQLRKPNFSRMNSLLRNSLNIKFKPGPLSRKRCLDMSFQKYNFGRIELAKLPNPGLDVIPEYGKPLELTITNYLNALRDESGIISDKWAEFAVSTLGKEENGSAVQLNKDRCITFDLKYKYEQRRLLMRCSDDYHKEKTVINSVKDKTIPKSYTEIDVREEKLAQDVSAIIDDMVTSVEISLLQNNLYTGEDPPRNVDTNDLNTSSNSNLREKLKKNGELNRLDVTVIRLSDTEEKNSIEGCNKSFCRLGCICESLFTSLHLKRHCGRVECMFECKCDFTKYNLHKVFEDEIVSGLVNLDKENNLKLSKEEQKFHQTVVLSGEKSILLKTRKRNWKAPKRYADFYSSMCLKTKKESKRVLSIIEIRLNCANIEPWCMVHNLYKCFCKGKFTEKLHKSSSDVGKMLEENSITKILLPENQKESLICESTKPICNSILRPRVHQEIMICPESQVSKDPPSHHDHQIIKQHCARTKAYEGRKYSNMHYFNANKKILAMEQNDSRLRKRMNHILNIEEINDKKKTRKDLKDTSAPDPCSPKATLQENETQSAINCSVQNEKSNNIQTCNSVNNETLSEIEYSQRKIGSQSWLKSVIMIYSQWFHRGLIKKALDPPRDGKMTLYPWVFIAERYRECKNYFLVTNYKPYRIFMAVQKNNALFHNCVDINTIVDVENYPRSIRALVKNENDSLKNHLCILRGLDFCWELVGCVEKLREVNKDNQIQPIELSKDLAKDDESFPGTSDNSISLPDPVERNTDQSKWFVMTLENDFTEIQFYNRGFFVKYDAIIQAIKVARVSDKTVRLSSQKCPDGNGGPQFGIYAIPNANEYCVFIGPYEKNEPLGIETVKSNLYHGKNKTRGVWFTTNKIDNIKVINNPLSFMAQIVSNNKEILIDSSQENTNTDPHSTTKNKSLEDKISPSTPIKILPKPIKITKTNNFYHLTTSGLLTTGPVSPEKLNLKLKSPLILNRCVPLNNLNTGVTKYPFKKITQSAAALLNENKKIGNCKIETPMLLKPIAEIAPQKKIVNDCDESNTVQHTVYSRKLKGGMSILKPEEINQRSLDSKINWQNSNNKNNTYLINVDDDINIDIEHFLANTNDCRAPSTDVFVISDDEDGISVDEKTQLWYDVGVVCKNIENMGWIPARQNKMKHLSFGFPGFDYSEFYPEEEALKKINKILSRKINIPRHLLELKWCVKEIKDLKDKQKLKLEDLGPGIVLTKQGPLHEFDLAERINKNECADNLLPKDCALASTSKIKEEPHITLDKNDINELEIESNLLDEETDRLFGKLRDGKPTKFFEISNAARQQMSERLRTIISSANNS